MLTQRELEAVISVLNDKIADLEYALADRLIFPNVREAIDIQLRILVDARHTLSETYNAEFQ